MLFYQTVTKIFINLKQFFTILATFIIILFDILESFLIILIIFCNIFLIFYTIFELFLQLSKTREPTYNLYPTLPQELSRIRNLSQNQNTTEINRQIIHPRRNRNFQTPRVHFEIPQSPSHSTPKNPTNILPETPRLQSQRSTSSLPSDYLGSTPTSEQIRENPFNPPNQKSQLPYWTTHSFTQGEPNLINDPIDISTDTTSSSLPETLSLPSTPSINQVSPTPFNLSFPNNLDARYREQSSTNIPLRLDWNTFTAPPPLFGQHLESKQFTIKI